MSDVETFAGEVEHGALRVMTKPDDDVIITVSWLDYQKLRTLVGERLRRSIGGQGNTVLSYIKYPFEHFIFQGWPVTWDETFSNGQIDYRIQPK